LNYKSTRKRRSGKRVRALRWRGASFGAGAAGRVHGSAGIVDTLIRDNNLPAYYFLLSVWMRLFGGSEVGLRSLSVLFYLGGCGAAFAIGRRLTGNSRAGCYSALLYEASALAIGHAHTVRMYSAIGMLSGLSTLAFLRLFRDDDRSPKSWAFAIAVNAIGILTHVWFVFVLVGEGTALLIYRRQQIWRYCVNILAAAMPFTILWGRNFVVQLHDGATN
jgi:uncharacterized membrane protein